MTTNSAQPFITCVACGAVAPETETAYTLIGAGFGWRLLVSSDSGSRIPEWHCDKCHRRLKATRTFK